MKSVFESRDSSLVAHQAATRTVLPRRRRDKSQKLTLAFNSPVPFINLDKERDTESKVFPGLTLSLLLAKINDKLKT